MDLISTAKSENAPVTASMPDAARSATAGVSGSLSQNAFDQMLSQSTEFRAVRGDVLKVREDVVKVESSVSALSSEIAAVVETQRETNSTLTTLSDTTSQVKDLLAALATDNSDMLRSAAARVGPTAPRTAAADLSTMITPSAASSVGDLVPASATMARRGALDVGVEVSFDESLKLPLAVQQLQTLLITKSEHDAFCALLAIGEGARAREVAWLTGNHARIHEWWKKVYTAKSLAFRKRKATDVGLPTHALVDEVGDKHRLLLFLFHGLADDLSVPRGAPQLNGAVKHISDELVEDPASTRNSAILKIN